MSNLINIGMSGLNASQAALATTGNNIANAATSGYSRQSVMTSTSALQNIGVGYIGTGTTLSDVRRIYNSFFDAQLQTTTALSGDSKAYLDQIGSVDKLLSDSTTGISSVLTSFFAAAQKAAATPNDASTRQLLLTQAQTLSNRFNSVSSQLSQQNDKINSDLTTLTGQVNKITTSIAALNKQIVQLSASGSTPNSLLDARNEAVRSLNELVGVTVQDRDGVYDVSLGTGQPLVSGTTSNSLSVGPSATDKNQLSIQLNYPQSSVDVTSVITGGEIGGMLRYRSDVLVPATNELGRMALVVSDTINSQMGQGLDANGAFGSSIFSNINSATAITQRSQATTGNSLGSGNLNVVIKDSSRLSIYDYKVSFDSATVGQYSVMRSDGTSMGSFNLNPTPPATTPVIDGFSFTPTGTPVQGDTFLISPTRAGAASIKTELTDANRLAFAAPLAITSGTGNGGTGVITQPSLTTKLDIYGNAAEQAALKSAIDSSMPVKLVFGTAAAGVQPYKVYGADGTEITAAAGSIVPGQKNDLSINIPYGTPAKTFSFSTSITGSPTANDNYSVSFNDDGKTDNRNALTLLELQTKATVGASGGSNGISFTNAYGKLVEQVGAKTAQAAVDTTATSAILTESKARRDSVSGVNLDEEAANLVKYQQYYTASSQIIKTAQDMFSTLINSL
ncbi:flagellar hook-associated protein FlgK [Pseudomonas syringae]|uniref:Flagellar hook-associated protein 1 n=1 Tax=Pseudomonas syringae TaxID=317 RepID=A0A085V3G9_PSESX|nr:flagellar hook-associated protein FlgK [Pseudomonas syringae]KFE49982.1 flagellar hook protein FlgK [Pseudomonas syringae]